MDAERIWAPWRIGYVAGELAPTEPLQEPKCWTPGADSSCFLCRASATYDDAVAADRQNLVVRRDSCVVTLLNRFPYANGHLLVAPTRHVADLDALRPDEHLEAMNALGQFAKQIKKQLKAEGFNVGLNLGRVAGAGVPGHLHWHLVPRWPGDHNFMPSIGGVRVIPQSLEAVWEALTEAT